MIEEDCVVLAFGGCQSSGAPGAAMEEPAFWRKFRPCPAPASLQRWDDASYVEPDCLRIMVNGLCSQVLGCRESALGENDSGECSPGGSPTPSMSSSCSSGSSYISVGSVGASAHSSSCRFRGEYNLLNAAETLATRGKGATSGTSWSASQAAAAAAGGCSPHSAQRPAVQHDPQQPAPRSPPACCVASGSFSPRPALGAAQPATPTTTRLGVPVSDVARGAADLLGPVPAAAAAAGARHSAAPVPGPAHAASACLDFLGGGMVAGLKPLNVPRHLPHFAANPTPPSGSLPPLIPLAASTTLPHCCAHQEATAGSLPRLAFWQQQEQQLPSWPSTAVAVWSPRPLAEWAAGGGVGGQRCTGLRRSPGCGDLRRVGAAAAQAAVVDALVGLVVAGLFC